MTFKTKRDFFKLQHDYKHRVFSPAVVTNVIVFSCIYYLSSYHEKAINVQYELAKKSTSSLRIIILRNTQI